MTQYYNFNILDIQLNCEIEINKIDISCHIRIKAILNNEVINIPVINIYNGCYAYIHLNFLRDFNIMYYGSIIRFLPTDKIFIEKIIFNILKNDKYNKSFNLLHKKIRKIYENKKYFTSVEYYNELSMFCGFKTSDDCIYVINKKYIIRLLPDFSEAKKIEIEKLFNKINSRDEYSYTSYRNLHAHIIDKSNEIYNIENIQLSEDMKSITLQFDKCDSIVVNIDEFE